MSVYQDRMSEFMTAAPQLASSPGVALSLAASSSATSQDAKRIAMTAQGVELASFLNGLSGRTQVDAWARLSTEDRSIAFHFGHFRPPEMDVEIEDPSLLGGIVDAAKWTGGKAMGALSTVLRPIDWAAEQVKHGQRTSMALAREQNAPEALLPVAGLLGPGVALAGNLFGIDEVERKWDETQQVKGILQVTGDSYFDPGYLNQVRERYSPETFEIGLRIARGESRESIIASEQDPAKAGRLSHMLRSEVMHEAVDEINGAKLSMGRQVARSWLGMTPDDAGWKQVSGLVDGVNTFFMDPTIVGAKVTGAIKVGKWGMGGLNETRIDQLFQQRQVQRYFDGATEHINKLANNAPDAGVALERLATEYRTLNPALRDQLVRLARENDGNITTDDVRSFLLDSNNRIEILRGQSAYREPLMLRKSWLTENVSDRIRRGVRKPINWLEGGPEMAARLAPFGDDFKPSVEASTQIERLRRKFADENDVLFQRPDRQEKLDQMIQEVLDQDRAIQLGRRTAALRGESVSRIRDRLPAVPEKVGGRAVPERIRTLGGKGARTGPQSSEFSRAERIKYRTAQVMTRFSERVATGHDAGRLDLTAEDSTEQVYRIARSFMSRHVANDLAADFNAADLAGKRNIVKGLTRSVAEAAGLGKTEQGRALMKKLIDEPDLDDPQRAYSAAGQDELANGRKAGVFSFQQQTHVTMPHYRELQAASAKVGILSHFGDFVTADFLDRGMELWRASVLINARRVLREGGEEVLGHVLRYGALDFARGQRARRLTDKEVRRAEKQGFHENIVEDINERIEDARGFGLREGDKDYLLQRDEFDHEFYADAVRGSAIRADRINDRGVDRGEIAKVGGKMREISFRPTGKHEVRDVHSAEGARAWSHMLRTIIGTQEGKLALYNIDDPTKAVDEISRLILSDEWGKLRTHSEIFREGLRTTGSDVAAARDWATRIYLETKHHLSDPDGNLLSDLVGQVRYRSAPDGAWTLDLDKLNHRLLKEIPTERRPVRVVAPELVHVDTKVGMIEKVMRGGYGAIASANNAMSRGGIYHAHWLDARRQLQGYEDDLTAKFKAALTDMPAEKAEALARKQAVATTKRQANRMAEERTMAMVDNPDVRSQFSMIARNMIPFWRAQEEFYRRWGRMVRYHPEAIRKAALTYEGLEHSGFIQEDDQGNEFFIYPGANMAAATVNKVGRMFNLDWAMTPSVFKLRGQVRFLNSGFDPKNIQPSFGPLAAMPLKGLNFIMPESRAALELERLALGDQGAGRSFWSGLLPTDLRRMYQAGVFGNESEQMQAHAKKLAAYQEYDKRSILRENQASATIRAIQMMEAAGMTPPEGADDVEVEKYKDRLLDNARAILVLRGVFGAFLPAAPEQDDIAPEVRKFQGETISNVKDAFIKLAAKVGYERAYETWLKAHPDEMPFHEGQTESVSGATLPPTEMAGQFLEENKTLFRQFPKAAPFLFPHADEAKFDPDTYRGQVAAGLRRKRSFEDFYLDMKLTGYVGEYYRKREKFQAAEADARAQGNTEYAVQIQNQWSAVSKQYRAAHPLLDKYISQGGQRAVDRDLVADEVRRMVSSGAAQHVPAAGALKRMVDLYDEYKFTKRSLGDSRTKEALAMRNALKTRYDQQMKAIADSDINAEMLYSRVFRFMED